MNSLSPSYEMAWTTHLWVEIINRFALINQYHQCPFRSKKPRIVWHIYRSPVCMSVAWIFSISAEFYKNCDPPFVVRNYYFIWLSGNLWTELPNVEVCELLKATSLIIMKEWGSYHSEVSVNPVSQKWANLLTLMYWYLPQDKARLLIRSLLPHYC